MYLVASRTIVTLASGWFAIGIRSDLARVWAGHGPFHTGLNRQQFRQDASGLCAYV